MTGVTTIGGGYQSKKFYVPLARQKELSKFLQKIRNAVLIASDEEDVAKKTTAELEVSRAAKQEQEAAELAQEALVPKEVVETDPQHTFQMVPCVSEEDVLAQQKSAGNNMKFSEDRHPLNELLALLEPITAREHKDRCAENSGGCAPHCLDCHSQFAGRPFGTIVEPLQADSDQ